MIGADCALQQRPKGRTKMNKGPININWDRSSMMLMFFVSSFNCFMLCTDAGCGGTGDGENWRLAASLRVSDIITLTTDIGDMGESRGRGILIAASLVNYCSGGQHSR